MEQTEPRKSIRTSQRPILSGNGELISNQVMTDQALGILVYADAFHDDGRIPRRHSAEGDNLSPQLSWDSPPEGTREMLVVCEDPDAPRKEPFVHWVLFNISPDTAELPEGISAVANPPIPSGATQCLNSGETMGYMGPLPPIGHGVHHYHFQIFALDTALLLPERVDQRKIVEAINRHVIGVGELVGTYERK